MQEINLNTENTITQIKINGHVFDVKVSDHELYELYAELVDKLRSMNGSDGSSVLDTCNFINGLFARILGEGSLEIISGGMPVGIGVQAAWIQKIVTTLIKGYGDLLAAEYE